MKHIDRVETSVKPITSVPHMPVRFAFDTEFQPIESESYRTSSLCFTRLLLFLKALTTARLFIFQLCMQIFQRIFFFVYFKFPNELAFECVTDPLIFLDKIKKTV